VEPVVRRPETIRNVAVVGHAGSGKSTLVEALLTAAGARTRSPGSPPPPPTTELALWSVEHAGLRLNLLDTPGAADFVAGLRAGLRAADSALFVVSAVDGIDARTRDLWEECAAQAVPRAVVVTKLDLPRADLQESVALCRRVFGDGVQPLYLPLHGEDGDAPGGVDGLLGLLSLRVFDHSGAPPVWTPVERDADPQHRTLATDARAELIEGIISESEDETLLDRWLGGEELSAELLVADLEAAVARGHFYPVLGVAAPTGLGIAQLLEVLTGAFPSPPEAPLPVVTRPDGSPAAPVTCDPAGPLLAEVVRTTTDAYVGRVSLVRVFSGTLLPDSVVHVRGADPGSGPDGAASLDKAGALARPLGATLQPLAGCGAGDCCAVTHLSRAGTGDTLSAPGEPLRVRPWQLPEPQLPVALEPERRADEDKLAAALNRVATEDPALRLERAAATGQLLAWCTGELHASLLLERLRTVSGVAVRTPEVVVPLRETLARPGRGHGRHVKQSGGHGQFAVCDLTVEPLPVGSGITFASRVVGGAVPAAYVAAVEKGVRATAARGLRAGVPLVDVAVTLVDGRTHAVDSSDAAFAVAGGLALREAAADGGTVLLEPVARVRVLVADGDVGAVLGDLAARRGRVTGTAPADTPGPARTVVTAEVPEAALVRYALDLPALSHGTGSFSREPLGWEPAPPPR